MPLLWRVSQLAGRCFPREMEAQQQVRFFFAGRLLDGEETLEHAGVADGCVLHTHVVQADAQPAQQGEVLLPPADPNGYPGHLGQYTPAQLALMQQMQLQYEADAAHGGPGEGTN